MRTLGQLDTGWDVNAFLLADLYHAFTGNPHPARPQPKGSEKSGRYSRLREALEKQRERVGKPTDA